MTSRPSAISPPPTRLSTSPSPAGEGKLDLTASLGRTVQLLAQPEGLAARAAEDYTLGTAAWIDATLVQGIWYDMTASLLVPGLVVLVVDPTRLLPHVTEAQRHWYIAIDGKGDPLIGSE